MIVGVDVFSGYGRIDWARVAASGVKFAFVKCSEGNEPMRNDSRFAENVAGCKAAGIYVGAYHFSYALTTKTVGDGRSPEEQARRAYGACGGLGMKPGELPPVIDAEWPEVGDWGKWGVTAASLSGWHRAYCEEATRLWGRKPIIYTYPFWWRTVNASVDQTWARDYPLWIANYTHSGLWSPPDDAKPIIPNPWDDWVFWQFSAKGSTLQVPGIQACPVDRDVFRGDLDALRRLANIEPEAPTLPDLPQVNTPIVHESVDAVPDAVAEYQKRRDGERGEE